MNREGLRHMKSVATRSELAKIKAAARATAKVKKQSVLFGLNRGR
jgi:hypothetical protein